MDTRDRLLQPGDVVFVVDRRLFEDDLRRHFVGTVEFCTDTGFIARGYPFLHSSREGNFVRKNNPRTRLFSFFNEQIINLLPKHCNVDKVEHVVTDHGTILTDNDTFRIDVSEFGLRR